MSERDGEGVGRAGDPADLSAVVERLSELQQRKRGTVRWHMSRETAERAIAAITAESSRQRSGAGKSRRRKRYKRML